MRMRIICRIIPSIKFRARVRTTKTGTPHAREPIRRNLGGGMRTLSRVVRRVAVMSPRRAMRMTRARCRHVAHGRARRGGVVSVCRVVRTDGHRVAGTRDGRRAGAFLPVFLRTKRGGRGHIAVKRMRGLGLLLAASLLQELLDSRLVVLIDLDNLLVAKSV